MNRVNLKTLCGRDRKCAAWKHVLYIDMLSELERIKSYGVNMTTAFFRSIVLSVIDRSPDGCAYHRSVTVNGM